MTADTPITRYAHDIDFDNPFSDCDSENDDDTEPQTPPSGPDDDSDDRECHDCRFTKPRHEFTYHNRYSAPRQPPTVAGRAPRQLLSLHCSECRTLSRNKRRRDRFRQRLSKAKVPVIMHFNWTELQAYLERDMPHFIE